MVSTVSTVSTDEGEDAGHTTSPFNVIRLCYVMIMHDDMLNPVVSMFPMFTLELVKHVSDVNDRLPPNRSFTYVYVSVCR